MPTDEHPVSDDERLDAAYRAADYVCAGHTLRTGTPQPAFDAWLRERGYAAYSFVTPHNPMSEPLPPAKNAGRYAEFLRLIEARGYEHAPAAAHDPAGAWPTEHGVLLFDVPQVKVRELARDWQQNAVVEGRVGEAPRVVWV